MEIPLYQVDAFTSRLFGGNPAAICPLNAWLDDSLMQRIAAENNLSETAFFVGQDGRYQIRWFTPSVEVDLCGHATLAAAYVIFRFLAPELDRIVFDSKSGELIVHRDGDLLALDFPSRPPLRCHPHPRLIESLGTQPLEILAARDYFVVFPNENDVLTIQPNFELMKILDRFAVIVTAPGREADFVSRFFAPAQGIDEDPVTGSAHCTLIPYWARRLGKSKLRARQLSPRGGGLFCEDHGQRVRIAGHAALFLEGVIHLED